MIYHLTQLFANICAFLITVPSSAALTVLLTILSLAPISSLACALSERVCV